MHDDSSTPPRTPTAIQLAAQLNALRHTTWHLSESPWTILVLGSDGLDFTASYQTTDVLGYPSHTALFTDGSYLVLEPEEGVAYPSTCITGGVLGDAVVLYAGVDGCYRQAVFDGRYNRWLIIKDDTRPLATCPHCGQDIPRPAGRVVSGGEDHAHAVQRAHAAERG